jgi:hypothetical protein
MISSAGRRSRVPVSPSGPVGKPASRSTHVLRPLVASPSPMPAYDARDLQASLGHHNIQHAVRYTELALERFKNFWR